MFTGLIAYSSGDGNELGQALEFLKLARDAVARIVAVFSCGLLSVSQFLSGRTGGGAFRRRHGLPERRLQMGARDSVVGDAGVGIHAACELSSIPGGGCAI